VALIVDQRLYEVWIGTRDRHRRYPQTPGALADQVDVGDGLELVRRTAEPLRLGVEQDQLLVPDDWNGVSGIGLPTSEVDREFLCTGDLGDPAEHLRCALLRGDLRQHPAVGLTARLQL